MTTQKENYDALGAAISRVAAAKASRNQPTAWKSPSEIRDIVSSLGPVPQLQPESHEMNFLQKILEPLGRPMSAIANLAKDTFDADPNTDNPLESIWAALSGVDHTDWTQVIEAADKRTNTHTDDFTKGVVGTILNFGLDPLMYTPLGWVTKPVRAATKALTGGKLPDAVAREAGHVIPGATTREEAIAREMPTPEPGAGPQPLPSRTPSSQLPLFERPSTTNRPTSANSQRVSDVLGAPRTAPETIPLFDEAGRDTYRLSNAGPKAAEPAFDLAKMGDDLKNLAATDPRQLRRVGLNGPAVAAHAGEQQLGLFGAGDLTSVPGKAAEEVTSDVAAAAPSQPAIPGLSKRYIDEVSKIPTNWPQGIKDSIAEAAKTPLKNAMKLPRKVDPNKIVKDLNKQADDMAVNDSVAAKVTDQPGVVTPAPSRGGLSEAQVAAREDSEKAVEAFTSSGTPMTSAKLRDMRAEREAKQFGESKDAAYTRIYGKDTSVPGVTAPNTTGTALDDVAAAAKGTAPGAVTSEAIKQGAKMAGVPLAEAARVVTGKEAVEVLQDGRKLNEPTKLSHQAQWRAAAQDVKQINDDLVKQGYKGEALVAEKMTKVVASVEAREAAHIAKGMYPEITSGADTYRMGLSDVWKALDSKTLRDTQFTTRNIPISSQQTAAATVLSMVRQGASEEEAIKKIASALSAKPGAHWTGQEIAAEGSRAMRNARGFWEARARLYDTMIENESTFKTRDAIIAKQVGESEADNIIRKLDDPEAGVGEKMNAIADMNRNTTRAARERGASAGGSAAASAAAAQRLRPHMAPLDAQNARHVQTQSHAQSRSSTWNTLRNGRGGQSQQQVRQVGQANASANIQAIRNAAATGGTGMDDLAGVTSDSFFGKIMDGLGKRFSGGWDMGTLFGVGRGQLNRYGDIAGRYAARIAKAQATHGDADSAVALAALQAGIGKAGLTAKEAAAYDDMLAAAPNVVSLSKGILSWGDTPAFREAHSPEMLEQVMANHGLAKYKFRPKDNDLEVPEQWREWQIEGSPWQFFTNMHHAQMELAARSAVGRYFTEQWGSKVAKEGYVKIARTQGKADMSHTFDTDLFYPKEAAVWMGKYSREIDSITKTNKIGNKLVSDWLDPALSMWKTSTTVIRPGHWVRNYIGDALSSGMDGVWNPLMYRRAAKVQRSNGAFKHEFEDINKLLDDTMPLPNDHAMTVTLKNGSKVPLANNQILHGAHRAGLLLDYRPAEDIIENAGKSSLGKMANRIEQTRYVKKAGDITTWSSDNSRLAHLMGLMSDPRISKQYNSVEEMITGLTSRVQKFHPDVKGLTQFEQTYMRRIIPFYSWFKQVMPTVFITTLAKPATATAIPKAQYGLNVAMGGDPQNIWDQFDPMKLYPDFLKDKALGGPIMNLLGNDQTGAMINFGSPIEAVADTFNGNIGANIAGMLNPLIKQPWGLISGDQPLDPGHYIPDKGEWIDQALPFVNQIANVTGFSPTGSLQSLLSEGKIDPQRAMAKGEKQFLDNQNVFNFLTGLNMQTTERESYYDIARKNVQARRDEADPFSKKNLEASRFIQK